MAQEFASDNSKNGLFDRLKLSNHRGFFSFLFMTLSVIFILVTFSAIQQQQTTQSKAATNICEGFSCGLTGDISSASCSGLIGGNGIDWKRATCCSLKPAQCVNKSGRDPNCNTNCSAFNQQINSSNSVINTAAKRACTSDSCCSFVNSSCITKTVNSCEGFTSDQCKAFGDCLFTGGKCENKFTSSVVPGTSTACKTEGQTFNLAEYPQGSITSTNNIPCCTNLIRQLDAGSTIRGKCISPHPAGGQGPSVGEFEYCSTFNSRPNGDIQCISSSNGKCTWDEARKCIPKTTTQQPQGTDPGTTSTGKATACTAIVPQSQATCLPASDCTWLADKSKCQRVCSRILEVDKDKCTKRSDCEWKDNACVASTEDGDDGGGETGTTVKCTNEQYQNETACQAQSSCAWIIARAGDKKGQYICQRSCPRITDQPNCDKRSDCEWKDNACVASTGGGDDGGGDEATGSADLNLKLAFQGIVTLPKTKTELKARVKLIDAVNKEKIKDAVQFTADSNGIWSGKATFEGIDLNQKYYLLIKGPLHLQKKICKADATDPQPGYYSCQFGNITLNDANNDLDFSNVKLLVGDIDQNGVVDSADTSVVFNDLLLPVDQRQSSEVLDRSDLNLDGIVSTQDWSLILEAMKIKYDEK